MTQDALYPHHRLGVAAADIADQPAPFGRTQRTRKRRQRGERSWIKRDLAQDRVALGDFAKRTAIGFDLTEQLGELALGQEIRFDDKAVASEVLAVGSGDQAGKP